MFEGANVKVNMPGDFEMISMDIEDPAVSLNLKNEKQGERKWNSDNNKIMNAIKAIHEKLTGKAMRRETGGRDDR